MDKKFIKQNKLDKLDLPTLLKVIELTKQRTGIIKFHANLTGSSGDCSPTRLKVRVDELNNYAGYLQNIADVLNTMQGE